MPIREFGSESREIGLKSGRFIDSALFPVPDATSALMRKQNCYYSNKYSLKTLIVYLTLYMGLEQGFFPLW